MRLLHFADLHLGIERYGHPDPSTGLNSRFLDFLKVLDEIVETAISAEVDLVVFCGDAYKNYKPAPTEQREFARRLSRLASEGIIVFLLVGNHDRPQVLEQATSLDIYQALAIENIIVSARPEVYRLNTKRGKVQILSLPWARPSALLVREEAKNLSLEQLNSLFQERLNNIVAQKARELDPDIPAIFAGHLTLDSAQVGSEQEFIWKGDEPIWQQSQLASLPVKYIALGHIHRPQVLNTDPPIVYAGSPERIDFSEAGDEKGFFLVELDKSVNFSFHRASARPFFELKIEILPGEKGQEKIFKAIRQNEERIKGAVFRLNITSPEPVSIEGRELREALSQAYFIAPTVISIRQPPRQVRLSPSVGALTPLEALEIYFGQKKFPQEKQKKLLEYARRLLSE